MAKRFITLMLSVLWMQLTVAQKATLHISIANTKDTTCYLWIPAYSLRFDFLKKGSADLALCKKKSVSYTISLTEPLFVNFYCASDTSNSKSLTYTFFVSPGDDIFLKADFNKKDNDVMVTGRGSNNNQPLIGTLPGTIDREKFKKDTLPDHLLTEINKQNIINKNAFSAYLKKYKPSAAFIKSWQYNIDYYAPYNYYHVKEEAKYDIREVYYRNFEKWKRVNDSLFATIKLNNNAALTANNYLELIKDFLNREKERLWNEAYSNPESFYKQWYNSTVADGEKQFQFDETNQLQEKIINKYFTGKVAAYAYAILLEGALQENHFENIVSVFERFKQQYPQSKYIKWFSPSVNVIAKRLQQLSLNADKVFVSDNGTKLNTFNEVLALTKGKTILLDMWGTWCGPCRSEIENNSQVIKAYFKDKGLDYLYVANHDLQNEKKWKELIAYFDLKGTHILANDNLNNDIMEKVKGTGYPTYIIIKKDGSYEQSKAGYPMNRAVLIKQLEAALAQ